MVAVSLFKPAPSLEVEEASALPCEFHTAFPAENTTEFGLVLGGDSRIGTGVVTFHAIGSCAYIVDGVEDAVVNPVQFDERLGVHQQHIGIADDDQRILIVLADLPLFLGTFA